MDKVREKSKEWQREGKLKWQIKKKNKERDIREEIVYKFTYVERK